MIIIHQLASGRTSSSSSSSIIIIIIIIITAASFPPSPSCAHHRQPARLQSRSRRSNCSSAPVFGAFRFVSFDCSFVRLAFCVELDVLICRCVDSRFVCFFRCVNFSNNKPTKIAQTNKKTSNQPRKGLELTPSATFDPQRPPIVKPKHGWNNLKVQLSATSIFVAHTLRLLFVVGVCDTIRLHSLATGRLDGR